MAVSQGSDVKMRTYVDIPLSRHLWPTELDRPAQCKTQHSWWRWCIAKPTATNTVVTSLPCSNAWDDVAVLEAQDFERLLGCICWQQKLLTAIWYAAPAVSDTGALPARCY